MKTKVFFTEFNDACGLKEAQSYGRILSMPELIKKRIDSNFEDEIWKNWYTALTEQDFIIDRQGKFTDKGKPVIVTVHGGGLLSNPETLAKKRKQNGGYCHALYEKEEADQILEGLPKETNQPSFPVIAYDDFVNISELPDIYAVVVPFERVTTPKDCKIPIDKLRTDPLAIVCAGGTERLNTYLDKMQEAYHADISRTAFNIYEHGQECGTLLHLTNDAKYNLGGPVLNIPFGATTDGIERFANFISVK